MVVPVVVVVMVVPVVVVVVVVVVVCLVDVDVDPAKFAVITGSFFGKCVMKSERAQRTRVLHSFFEVRQRAISCAPRGQRFQWLLKVQAATD